MIASLCEAFADDPGLKGIWPERTDRLRRLPYFFKPIVRGTLPNGIALHSAGSDAVSLWRQPGKIDPARVEILRGLPSMAKAFGTGRERAQLMSSMFLTKVRMSGECSGKPERFLRSQQVRLRPSDWSMEKNP